MTQNRMTIFQARRFQNQGHNIPVFSDQIFYAFVHPAMSIFSEDDSHLEIFLFVPYPRPKVQTTVYTCGTAPIVLRYTILLRDQSCVPASLCVALHLNPMTLRVKISHCTWSPVSHRFPESNPSRVPHEQGHFLVFLNIV